MSSDGRTFGHISGVQVGTVFKNKHELLRAGVHMMHRGGIHGDKELGAFSICLSKGHYNDNVDNGNTIKYVGSGANEDGVQRDQSFENQFNQALLVSSQTKRPVRVVRGVNEDSYYAPAKGYRYDGLYVVEEATMEKGIQGSDMCTFRLKRIEEEGQKPIPTKSTLTMSKMLKMSKQSRST